MMMRVAIDLALIGIAVTATAMCLIAAAPG